MFANFKYKKIILKIILILTIPLWLMLFNYISDFLIQTGRITGTYIRVIGAKTKC